MSISWGALAGAFLAPFMYGLFWKGVTKAACMASFIAGVGITVIHMAYYTLAGHTGTLWGINLASPINAGAFAMLFGLVLVPIVCSFLFFCADNANDIVRETTKQAGERCSPLRFCCRGF